MERFAEHDDGPLAVRRDEDHVARVRLLAPRGVDVSPGGGDARADLLRRLVVAERGEEVDLGG